MDATSDQTQSVLFLNFYTRLVGFFCLTSNLHYLLTLKCWGNICVLQNDSRTRMWYKLTNSLSNCFAKFIFNFYVWFLTLQDFNRYKIIFFFLAVPFHTPPPAPLAAWSVISLSPQPCPSSRRSTLTRSRGEIPPQFLGQLGPPQSPEDLESVLPCLSPITLLVCTSTCTIGRPVRPLSPTPHTCLSPRRPALTQNTCL